MPLKRMLLLLLCPLLLAAKQPNIVLLFADDAGYADFGFQGSETFKTPHLDRMAEKGMVFRQLYVTDSVCGPSRAGLLTGRYQQRFGFEENNVPGIMSASGLTGEDMGLPLELKTMADYLKKEGYRTGLFGKWHQGEADRYHPLKRGFDEFVGFRSGARSFFPYKDLKKAKPAKWMERGFGHFEEPENYITDFLADETCAFIERNQERPFFAFVSFNAVHTPMEPDPQFAELFPQLKGKRRQLAQMTVSLDLACGKIMDRLAVLGLEENTLVVFTNDNGGPTDVNRSNNYPLAGTKANHLEGGIRVPGFAIWPGKIPAGSTYPFPVSTLDFLPTFLKAAGGNLADLEVQDGVDLLPYLAGEKPGRPHEVLFWKKEGRGVIRKGNWKMLRYPDRPAELFDISKDESEQHDLADQHPELVRQLYKELFAWEMELERPLWQLKRVYEQRAADRIDSHRSAKKPLIE